MDTKKILNPLWTARWHLNKGDAASALPHVSEAIDILEGKTEAPKPEPAEEEDRPSVGQKGAKLLWCPFAETSGKQMKTNGTYPQGHPEGAIPHFSAGQCDTEDHAKAMADWGANEGLCFFVIGPTGKIYQRFPLNRWGSHAGKSSYPGLGSSVSKRIVGIEVACAGKLDANGKSWFGKTYSKDRIRTVKAKDNMQAGNYLMFTKEQEEALEKLLLWLHHNNPEVFKLDYVVGHDEVSPGRKNDPGGSLSMTMPEYRKHLKALA